jgi:hypothetical protein
LTDRESADGISAERDPCRMAKLRDRIRAWHDSMYHETSSLLQLTGHRVGSSAAEALLRCMVRRLTAREKLRDEKVCANVSVNRGEGVVKGRDFLTAAMSKARDQGV